MRRRKYLTYHPRAGIKVVVLGGGYAGSAVVKALAGRVSLTLVEPSDRFFHNIGAPRALAVDGFEAKLFVPYDRVLAGAAGSAAGAATHLRGSATSVDADNRTVTVAPCAGGEPVVLPYDILVVALGTMLAAPAKPSSHASADAAAELARVRGAVAAAGTVVIVGGGPTGVEMAGEIATVRKPAQAVHLVHRGAALLGGDGLRPALVSGVAAALAKLGVVVHLNASVAAPSPPPAGVTALAGGGALVGAQTLALSDGTALAADVVIFATGGAPAVAALRASPSLAGSLTDAGCLRVDAALRVAGQPRIFAAGDIAAGPVPDAKLGYVAGVHAAVVARNVAALAAALASGAPDAALVRMPRAHKAMAKRSLMITVGPGAAFGQMNGGGLPGWIIKAIKGKDLITGKVNADLGWNKAGEYGGAAAPAVV